MIYQTLEEITQRLTTPNMYATCNPAELSLPCIYVEFEKILYNKTNKLDEIHIKISCIASTQQIETDLDNLEELSRHVNKHYPNGTPFELVGLVLPNYSPDSLPALTKTIPLLVD